MRIKLKKDFKGRKYVDTEVCGGVHELTNPGWLESLKWDKMIAAGEYEIEKEAFLPEDDGYMVCRLIIQTSYGLLVLGLVDGDQAYVEFVE